MTKDRDTATEQPGTYDVCLRGHLDPRWAERLGVPALVHEADGTTLLRGVTADQAALHGLLQRVRDLGVHLVSVTPVQPKSSD